MSIFGFLPHQLFTNHIAQDTTGLSPRLWHRISEQIMSPDGASRLFLVGDDFMSVDGGSDSSTTTTCVIIKTA